ncbi:prefoldin subunit 4-like [Clavelina lepadiformis]|uniref:prefoldin subunit 4-like n=1 Tax=Clavelina lepadiformis TaxID=159417 RepID=UPI0040420428
MSNSKQDDDAPVTYEDQKKINLFARKNVQLNELRSQVEGKKKVLQNVEDASDDLLLLEDENVNVDFKIGEVFIEHSQDETQDLLEKVKINLNDDISGLQKESSEIEKVMNDLKVQLYAKFGDNINLEP